MINEARAKIAAANVIASAARRAIDKGCTLHLELISIEYEEFAKSEPQIAGRVLYHLHKLVNLS